MGIPCNLIGLELRINDGVTIEELDRALGNGRALQALIGPKNPYRHVVFRTDWDDMPEEPEEEI